MYGGVLMIVRAIKACNQLCVGFAFGGRNLGADWGIGSSLDLKLKSLGARAEEVDVLRQAVSRRVRIAAHDNVICETDAGEQVKILLFGTTCTYQRNEDGGRIILSFQHAGDFCNLQRYVLPDSHTAIGVHALTD